ncbi:hypothetical protein LPJ73_009232, partial [Coemansia sp. RSA 2703]
YASPAAITLALPDDLQPSTTDTLTTVLHTSAALSTVTFCFVQGLPAAERVAHMADRLVEVLLARGVQRLVVPAAVNLVGTRDSEHLWVWRTETAAGVEIPADARKVPGSGVPTDDAFLSAVCALAEVAGLEVVALVHGDKRPAGTSGRRRTAYGGECADEGDKLVVGALAGALAEVVPGLPPVVSADAVQMEVTRTCHDVDSSAKGLAVYAKGKGKEPASMTPMSAPGVGPDGLTSEERLYQETVRQLQKTYAKKIKPLEQAYCFE